MPLKDWKKLNKRQEINKDENTFYLNDIAKLCVSKISDNKKYYYIVYTVVFKRNDRNIHAEYEKFQTKSQALKFAKSYMRKH